MPALETLVDAASLRDLLQGRDSRIVLLDARFDLAAPAAGREAYAAGHLPGAHYADLEHDLSGPVTAYSGRHPLPAPAALAERLAAWGIDSERRDQVVVYDAGSGAFAARVWWLLRWLGHLPVAVLDGGIAAWQRCGFPLSQDAPAPPAASTFRPMVNDDAWISTQALADRLQQAPGNTLLVDARAAPRFAGEHEPIDPVPGHVPGAVNFPFDNNLTAHGTFQSAAVLAERYAALKAAHGDADFIAMCGSGVTACHLLLAQAHAGHAPGRLYAGSWSEWIRDPARPVATGPST